MNTLQCFRECMENDASASLLIISLPRDLVVKLRALISLSLECVNR